jgi:hypothetical protein
MSHNIIKALNDGFTSLSEAMLKVGEPNYFFLFIPSLVTLCAVCLAIFGAYKQAKSDRKATFVNANTVRITSEIFEKLAHGREIIERLNKYEQELNNNELDNLYDFGNWLHLVYVFKDEGFVHWNVVALTSIDMFKRCFAQAVYDRAILERNVAFQNPALKLDVIEDSWERLFKDVKRVVKGSSNES